MAQYSVTRYGTWITPCQYHSHQYPWYPVRSLWGKFWVIDSNSGLLGDIQPCIILFPLPSRTTSHKNRHYQVTFQRPGVQAYVTSQGTGVQVTLTQEHHQGGAKEEVPRSKSELKSTSIHNLKRGVKRNSTSTSSLKLSLIKVINSENFRETLGHR